MITAYDIHNYSILKHEASKCPTLICRNCNRAVLPVDSVSTMGMNLLCNYCVEKISDYTGFGIDIIRTLVIAQGQKKLEEQIEIEDL